MQKLAPLLAAFLFLIPSPCSADMIAVTLDGVAVDGCNQPWTESGVELSFVATTSEDDCDIGSCDYGLEPDRVQLYPARLEVLVGGLAESGAQAEVDIVDYCRPGCTAAFLYSGTTTVDSTYNSTVQSPETLYLTSGGAPVDKVAVSSCEGAVVEMRLRLGATLCGDGTIQWREGETCEPPDSHIFGSWHCDAECQAYYESGDCGDGIIQWREGEQCEIPSLDRCGPRAECIDCVCKSTAYCGDGIVQWGRGERCDPPSSICGSRGNPNWVCSDTCECEFVGGE
jgi:hypothetical protein